MGCGTGGGNQYLLGETGDLVRPEVFGANGVVWVTVDEEVLEEAHVLEAEDGNLVLGLYVRLVFVCPGVFGKSLRRYCTYLMHNSRHRGVFAPESLLDAVWARRSRLLALLDLSPSVSPSYPRV